MSLFLHETMYRTAEVLARCRVMPVVICGAGALGAHIAEGLARAGFGRLRLIDRDRIEERNLSTQPYHRADIGGFKARVLAAMIYRAVGVEVETELKELDAGNVARLLRGAELVVDAFDNSISRRVLAEWGELTGVPCLHAGLADGYGEVIWNESYRVPSDASDDVCDYPLARNLVMLAASVACESIIDHAASGERNSYTITLRDLAIRPFAA